MNNAVRTPGVFGDAVAGHDDFEAEVMRLEGVIYNEKNGADTRAQALVELIRWYAANGVPAPAWILHRLLAAFDAFREGRAKSVNEALGMRAWPKKRRTRIRVDPWTGLSAAARIVLEVVERRGDQATDEALFERIGKALPAPMSAGAVKKTYYDMRNDRCVIAELRAFKQRFGIPS